MRPSSDIVTILMSCRATSLPLTRLPVVRTRRRRGLSPMNRTSHCPPIACSFRRRRCVPHPRQSAVIHDAGGEQLQRAVAMVPANRQDGGVTTEKPYIPRRCASTDHRCRMSLASNTRLPIRGRAAGAMPPIIGDADFGILHLQYIHGALLSERFQSSRPSNYCAGQQSWRASPQCT
jgi:hypothetical protein